MLENAKPYPTEKIWPIVPFKVYLFDNGTMYTVFGGSKTELVTRLENIVLQITEQQNLTITQEFLDTVLSPCKVVELKYRIYSDFHLWDSFDTALFILQDNLHQGLKGSFFIRQIIDGQPQWSRWIITK